MAIDLNKNRESLLTAWKEVSNTENKTDWALFGYEGQTNVLKLVEKGDGGLEELADELNSGKIMYAYCAVKDPNTGLMKYVLINWQGEGTPEIRKGSCARHVSDVQRLFRGAHVTINARTDEDIDPDIIVDKVSKSSGSNYSFHKETAKPVPEPSPVGSVYKKTLPQVEIKAKTRDRFWEEAERAEKERVEQEQRKKAQESAQLDRERREREEREASERDEKVRERMRQVHRMKSMEQAAEDDRSKDEKIRWEQEQQAALKDDEDRRKRSEHMRKERAAEAASLVGGKTKNVRNIFEQKPRSMFDEPEEEEAAPQRTAPPPRKLKHGFLTEQDAPAKPKKKKVPTATLR